MFTVSKAAVSKYVSAGCRRRLRLDLHAGAAERRGAGVPPKVPSAAKAAFLKELGKDHERSCFRQLIEWFGDDVVRGEIAPKTDGEEFALSAIRLADVISRLKPGAMALEVEYDVPADFAAVSGIVPGNGVRFGFGVNRPDIVLALSAAGRRTISADGRIIGSIDDDLRTGLSIIDIKLSTEAGVGHFAELSYYAMTLAAWLEANGFGDRFCVLADAMIWTGAKLTADPREVLTRSQRMDRWVGVMDALPAEVILPRVRSTLSGDLVEVMEGADWRAFKPFVSARCSGCDYLGHGVISPDPDHCLPDVTVTDGLSRVHGMSEGAAAVLQGAGVISVSDLAACSVDDPVFERHQALRNGRRTLIRRAAALSLGEDLGLVEGSSSAVLPRFSDIRVALSIEVDPATGVGFLFGYQTVGSVPVAAGDNPEWLGQYVRQVVTGGEVFPVSDPSREGVVFAGFLTRMQDAVLGLSQQVAAGYSAVGADRKPTVQFYVWDRRSFELLSELLGRHLAVLQRDLPDGKPPAMTFLFPPSDVMAEGDMVRSGHSVSVLSQAIDLLALNLPHAYRQVDVANSFQVRRPGSNREPFKFFLGPQFSDPFSDVMPSERAYQLWAGKQPSNFADMPAYVSALKSAASVRMNATLSVARSIAYALRDSLVAKAPTVEAVFAPKRSPGRISGDLRMLVQYSDLGAAIGAADNAALLARSPERREAGFASAILLSTIRGYERQAAALQLNVAADREVWVYRLSPGSADAKIKVGDNVRMTPVGRPDLRYKTLAAVLEEARERGANVDVSAFEPRQLYSPAAAACLVEVVAFAGREALVAVRISAALRLLGEVGVVDINFDGARTGVLDPIFQDMFTSKLRKVARAVGLPPAAKERPLISDPVTRVPMRAMQAGASVSMDGFLWRADELVNEASGRSVAAAWAGVRKFGRPLNEAQEQAVRVGIENRLLLLWGPPGTGKSATSKSLVAGLIADARSRGARIRIAITGPTWVAIDNLMAEMSEVVGAIGGPVRLARLCSPDREGDISDPAIVSCLVPSRMGDERFDALLEDLVDGGDVIVAGTANQLHRLAMAAAGEDGSPLQGLIDYMLIDEASQMSVSQAVVAFSTLSDGASLAVVGDDLQMPPIHPVDAPDGYAEVIGSIYTFYARYRVAEGAAGVRPVMLASNFRSNPEIVEYFARAGYPGLVSAHPGMRIGLDRVSDHAAIAAILDPEQPLVGIIHGDVTSAQRSSGEALAVAALVSGLVDVLRPVDGGQPYLGAELFRKGLGVVTPHRAQRSAVIEAILASGVGRGFEDEVAASVDTVERFQGQQRDVMIASFGMGDPDAIAGEEEFLFSLNRFNVIVSRARAKMIVLASRNLVSRLPADVGVLRASHLLKNYLDGTALPVTSEFEIPGLGRAKVLVAFQSNGQSLDDPRGIQ